MPETTTQENSGSNQNDIEMDREELRERARELGIPRYNRMSKQELSQAIQEEEVRIPTKKRSEE